MGRLSFYWQTLAAGIPVQIGRSFHVWRGVYGVQIGPWFFGVIKGDALTESTFARKIDAGRSALEEG